MTGELTIDHKFHVTRQHLGRKKLREGSPTKQPTGRIPRVARVMALAIRCEQLIRDGLIKNQSELAHYGQVTTARMTHIMWLVNLAPDIQEAILFLPRVESGPDPSKRSRFGGLPRCWTGLSSEKGGDNLATWTVFSGVMLSAGGVQDRRQFAARVTPRGWSNESAGINRLGVRNERVPRRRPSQSLRP